MKNPFVNKKETHGKDEASAVKKPVPSTLDQIWGEDGTSKFGTLDSEKYQNKLDNMTRSEIQAEAQKHGLVPIEDTKRLKKTLSQLFKEHAASYAYTPKEKTYQRKRNIGEKKKYPDEVLRILKEGA